MKIIKIIGKACSGKTTALSELASSRGTQVMHASSFKSLLPALKAKLVALAPSTYVDEVTPELALEIEALAAEYPKTYFIYLAMYA